jgi:D-arginine utilization repressor
MTSTPSWVRRLEPICESLAMLLSPSAEVVLHDIATDTIAGIWNSFSNRKVGDPALINDLTGGQLESFVMGPYEKVGPDGRRITSISSVFAADDGTPLALVCVNLDRSPMDEAIKTLAAMVAPATNRPPEVLFERDWREQISLTVHDWCRTNMVDRSRLTRSHRLELVRALDEADLFSTRHAAQHAAVALGVSRATIYTMLKQARENGQTPRQTTAKTPQA